MKTLNTVFNVYFLDRNNPFLEATCGIIAREAIVGIY